MNVRYLIYSLAVIAAAALCIGLALKLWRSERLRIFWNRPYHFYDGRHKLSGTARSVNFDIEGELWIRDKESGRFIRLIPNAGVELSGEQSVSLSSSRQGERKMYKIRPQWSADAEEDYMEGEWEKGSNVYRLYFEQRMYSNDTVLSYYKDFAYGPGGLFFVDPETGRHIAHQNFSTLYVPAPVPGTSAGPSNWLWAAAANRRFVEASVTGSAARAAWDTQYYRRVAPPASRFSPGEQGQIAFDDSYAYFYRSPTAGWLRVRFETEW